MTDETPAQARRRRRRASTPAVDLTDPDTETLEGFRRLRGLDHPAAPADDRPPSEPRALSTGHAVTPGARHTPTVDGTTVEKGEQPPC